MNYFAKINNGIVEKVIVAKDMQSCIDTFGGEWTDKIEKQPFLSWFQNLDKTWFPPVEINADTPIGSFWDESITNWNIK